MGDRERNIAQMGDQILVFNGENSADYAAIAEAAAQFAVVQSARDALHNYFATQASGGRAEAVAQKAALKFAIKRKMKRFSRTARAIAITETGFAENFKVPEGNNDHQLIAVGRQMVAQATTHNAKFVALGIPASLKTALEQDLDDFEAAINAKASAQSETVGATAGVDEEVDKLMEAAKVLDAIMQNVYDDEPVKHASWKTARHIKRLNSGGGDNNGQPPPDL